MTESDIKMIGDVLVALRQALEAKIDELELRLKEITTAKYDHPVWRPGVYRQGVVVSAYIGQIYRAVRDTAAEPYGSQDWERLGNGGLHVAGPDAEGRTYAVGDLVMKDYGTFLATEEGMHLLVGRGPKGSNGQAGRDGAEVLGIRVRASDLVLSLRDARGERSMSADLMPLLEKLGEAIRESIALERRSQ